MQPAYVAATEIDHTRHNVLVSGAVCCYSFAKTFGLKAALRLHIQ